MLVIKNTLSLVGSFITVLCFAICVSFVTLAYSNPDMLAQTIDQIREIANATAASIQHNF